MILPVLSTGALTAASVSPVISPSRLACGFISYLVKQSAYKELRFFRDYARKKWPLKGSKDADNLYRFQVSGFGCQEGESQNPETSYETTSFITKM